MDEGTNGQTFADSPLNKFLGEKTAKALTKAFGFDTVTDLLSHYPRRYAQRGELTDLDSLIPGESVTIVAEVVRVNSRPLQGRKGSLLEVVITDGAARLSLTFFNQAWRANALRTGARGIFAGKVTEFRGVRQLAHPDYELFDEDALSDAEAEKWAKTPIPIYPATSTMASWQIAKAVSVVLDIAPEPADPIPEKIRERERLLDFGRALTWIHRPEENSQWQEARDTLRFHEAFLTQLALRRDRLRSASRDAVPRTPGKLRSRFDSILPFELTPDQVKVGQEIDADMAKPHPMSRLVQGEVGSGKTVVALRAMLLAIEDGGQAVLIAPTEVLASQHFKSIGATLGEIADELGLVLMVGSLTVAERKRVNLAVASGKAKLVVGTHALLSESVTFNDLALVVIDEQHRFGVEQRDTLKRKGAAPHLLVLTATPIPRTVAMTVFGDLDTSVIRGLPGGRIPIESHLVPLADKPNWLDRVWQRIGEEVALGRQAFVVCSMIDQATEDESIEPAEETEVDMSRASVSDTLQTLRKILPKLRIEAVHGRMPADEKDATMSAFKDGRIDVLVATTVIEVGVDVPNASVMAIMDADRFGVSQLHQLRGRVGRGNVPGIALFVTRAENGTFARERVLAVTETLDGFELANRDLELRREGDVLGENQSGGRSGLRLLRVRQDADLILRAREIADELLKTDPNLKANPVTLAALEKRLSIREREFIGKS